MHLQQSQDPSQMSWEKLHGHPLMPFCSEPVPAAGSHLGVTVLSRGQVGTSYQQWQAGILEYLRDTHMSLLQEATHSLNSTHAVPMCAF